MKKVKQKKLYIDHAGRLFEFMSNSVQQSENSHGSQINTYPSVILKDIKTGELVSVLTSRLDLCFAPHFNSVKNNNDVKKVISLLDKSDLTTLLNKENFIKINEAADFLAKQYVKKWHRHVEPHDDFVGEIKNVIAEVLIAISFSKEKKDQK